MNSIQRRVLIVVAIIIPIAFIAWGIIEATTSRVTVDAVPYDMELRLDGKQVPAYGGPVRMAPGSHEFVAKRNGFGERTIKFDIKAGENKDMQVYLYPNSAEGEKWLKENPEQATKLEGETGKQLREQSSQRTIKYPILEQLPVIDPTFRIDYGVSKKNPDDPSSVALYIQALDQEGRNNAIDWIRYNGYKPEDYEIIYVTP